MSLSHTSSNRQTNSKKAYVSLLFIVKWLIWMAKKWNLIHCWKILKKKSFSGRTFGWSKFYIKRILVFTSRWPFFLLLPSLFRHLAICRFLLASCCSDFFFLPSKVLAFPRNIEKKSVGKNHRKEIKINEYIESIILKHRSTVTGGRMRIKRKMEKHTKISLIIL